jgi:hypothetical protein
LELDYDPQSRSTLRFRLDYPPHGVRPDQ